MSTTVVQYTKCWNSSDKNELSSCTLTNSQLITHYFTLRNTHEMMRNDNDSYLVRLLITFFTFFALFLFTFFFCTLPSRLFCFFCVLTAFVHSDLLRGSR